MGKAFESLGRFERRLDAKLVASMAAAGSMSFAAVVFETALNVALPTLMEEFSVGTATIQWSTSGYLLMLSVVIPTFPWLKSRFPLRRLFLVAVVLFIAGTLLCGCAPAFPVLLAGRLVQGVGTGIAIPLMFSIVVDQVPHEHMGMMMGFASLITALAPAVGPTYGGFVMSIASWRMVFLFLVPLVVVALGVGVTCLRQATPLSARRFDALGSMLVAAGFFALVYGCNLSADVGWISMPVLICLIAAVVAFVLFYRHAQHAERPLINVAVFSCRTFVTEVLVVLLVAFAILAFAYLVPNYAQLALGVDELTAGSLLLPGCLASVLFGPVGGRLLDRGGARLPIMAGMSLLVVATVLYAVMASSLTPMLMMGIYILFGVGQGLGFSTTMTNGLEALPEDERADGNSVLNTFQQLGGSIGVSVVTAVVGSAQSAAPDIATGTATGGASAFLLLAILMVVVLVLSALVLLRRG